MKSLDDALWALIEKAPPAPTTEQIAIGQALGRVLAEPVIAGFDVPSFDNSQMDGYAVRRADLQASVSADAFGPLPVSSRIAAGDPSQPLAAGSVASHLYRRAHPRRGGCRDHARAGCAAADGQVVFRFCQLRVTTSDPGQGLGYRPAGVGARYSAVGADLD